MLFQVFKPKSDRLTALVHLSFGDLPYNISLLRHYFISIVSLMTNHIDRSLMDLNLFQVGPLTSAGLVVGVKIVSV